MKHLILLIAVMLASPAFANTPLYIQEIIAARSGSNPIAAITMNIVKNNTQVRLNFAKSFGFPTLQQYTEEKLAEGMGEKEIYELYTTMFINSELQEFEIEQALANDPRLRSGVLASAFLASSFFGAFAKSIGASTTDAVEEYLSQLQNQVSFEQFLDGITNNAMSVSYGLMTIFPAVDSPDKSLTELIDSLSEIQMLTFDISYSDALSERMPEDSNLDVNSALAFAVRDMTGNTIGGNVGDYLRRTNHITSAPINDQERNFLTSIGITDEEIFKMIPHGLPMRIAQVTMSGAPLLGNDPNMVGELDYALVIDLTHEPGSLASFFVTLQILFDQDQYNYFKRYLNEELEFLGITMAELIALLRHPERPASLFQVLQLLHKGFSLADIAELEYETRDAIIISNAESKEDLLADTHYALEELDEEPTLEFLNKLIRTKGQLTLALLAKGYLIDDIFPHFSPKKTTKTSEDEAQDTGDTNE